MNTIPEIPGATEVVSWYGTWPSFHDAEIVSLHLNRSGPSTLALYYAFYMSGKVHASDRIALEEHALVTFTLMGISDVDIADFSCQNVISSLTIDRREKGFRITLSPCYGLCGTLDAETVSVRVQPGKPDAANKASDATSEPAPGTDSSSHQG